MRYPTAYKCVRLRVEDFEECFLDGISGLRRAHDDFVDFLPSSAERSLDYGPFLLGRDRLDFRCWVCSSHNVEALAQCFKFLRGVVT